MLEESISCSPGCETNRSQQRRFHRSLKGRHKRRSNRTSSTGVSFLEQMYEESENGMNSIKYELFNPFENEQFLAAADLARVPKSSISKRLPSTGFLRLQDLPLNENDDCPERIQKSTVPCPPGQVDSELQAQYGPETQFGITESELLRFCDDVEMDAKGSAITTALETDQNKKPVARKILEDVGSSQSNNSSQKLGEIPTPAPSETPLNKKSIVDAILEDFCSSPYIESPPREDAENATPVFRFRSKPIRTYAGIRRKRLRRNIETELVNVYLSDDDGSVSDSSGLSIQEDLTQNVVPQLDTVDLNNSIKVCENLLQLSLHFSQTISHDKTPQSSEVCRSLGGVIEEIMQLKRKSCIVNQRKSSEEFYGFSDDDSIEEFYGFSDEERKLHEDTLKELLEAEDDILQEIDCDSLCYEKVQPRASLSCNTSEQELGIRKVNSERMPEERESACGPTVCDSLSGSPRKLSHDSSLKEERLFEDIDLWNDNEYLLNYATQKPNVKPEKSIIETAACNGEVQESHFGFAITSKSSIVNDGVVHAACSGFSTASKKPIAISVEAKRRGHEFLSKFEQTEREQHATVNEINAQTTQASNKKTAFPEFATASRKPVTISSGARIKADQILKQFEQEEREQRMTDVLPSDANVLRRELTATSSFDLNKKTRKSNELPDEEKQKAEELLRDIEFFEDRFEEEDKLCTKAAQNSKSVFEGFKTASRKPIMVSEEAKRRADRLVREIQTEDVPKEFLECIQADLKEAAPAKSSEEEQESVGITFEGFKTASKKPIQISEVAKQKAEKLLNEVQFDDFPPEILKCIDADLKKSDSLTSAQNSNKIIFEGFKTASRKPIQISDIAKQRAEKMLKEVHTADLPDDFLKCIQADVKDSPAPTLDIEAPKFEGFQTASKKPIQISEAAKQRAEQLLKEIESEGNPKDFINCLESTPKVDSDTNYHSAVTKHEAQAVVSPQKAKELNNHKIIKRKSEACLGEAISQSPKRRISCNEGSLLNDIENAPLTKSTSHSDIKSTTKMSKKNLLSLSKRKKSNCSRATPKTPEKSDSSVLRCNANTTPNLQEFFDCVKTSTPRLMRTNPSKADTNHKDTSIDGDFQKINWENASNSSRVCKTNSFTDLNVTCVEVSPSPKQRIERLKMYGKPPPISPILMVNKCRPSGLRRGRSLMKS